MYQSGGIFMNNINTKSNYKVFLIKFWWIVPFLHFGLALLYSKNFFTVSDFRVPLTTVDMDSTISILFLRKCSMILAKSIAFMFIIGFWYLVKQVVLNKIPHKEMILFGIISIVMDVYIYVVFPTFFGLEVDNYITFQYAIRNLPFYWHGAITSAIYSAAYTVIPHPMAITLIQSSLFIGVVIYCFYIFRTNFTDKRSRLALLLLILPESYYIMLNPYRNCFYTILSVWGLIYGIALLRKKIQSSGTYLYYFH